MLLIFHNYILHCTFYILIYYINQEMQKRSRNFKALPFVYYDPFRLQPVDGFAKAEICCCYILLINYVVCNKVMKDYKIIYFLFIFENATGMPKLKKKPWPLAFYKVSKLLYFRLTLNNSILHAATIHCRTWPAQPCSSVVLSSILSFPTRIIDPALRREATFQLASLRFDTVHLLNKSAVDKVSSVIPNIWLQRRSFTVTDELKDFGFVSQALIKELQWKWFDIVILVELTVQGAQRGATCSLTTRMH